MQEALPSDVAIVVDFRSAKVRRNATFAERKAIDSHTHSTVEKNLRAQAITLSLFAFADATLYAG